jgi:hypothetical protein
MWDPRCNGIIKSEEECGGKYGAVGIVQTYGDPNRNLDGSDGRVRQVAGWRSTGLHNHTATLPAREVGKINPLPNGVRNKLQRDPSLPNILTVLPDLAMRECPAARTGSGGFPVGDPRNCSVFSDWNLAAQEERLGPAGSGPWVDSTRLGRSGRPGGLMNSMLWDFAFTGSENDLMAIIPYCENLSYTQRFVASIADKDSGQIGSDIWGPTRIDCSRGEKGEVLGRDRCTFITPQNCELVQALFGIAGQKRNILRAGGNGTFGRRTMQWQSGSEVYLAYEKRNVLGFSTDFAEDYTKSNWSMEFTWINGLPQSNNNSYDLTSDVDDFNLTVSMDRPTFINFLNANRTFFINSQWFFQYRKGWDEGMSTNGPWNVLATFAVFTGYFQDRLNPTLVFVYDFRSKSGGVLPQVNYRFSENFSLTLGAAIFSGSQNLVAMPVNGIAPASPRTGANAYQDPTEPGLSLIRDRDEVFMTLRYTF